MAPLSREAQLLLAIARCPVDPAGRERIRTLIQPDLDWDFLHHLASRHRLGMFLYKHLDEAAAPEVPRAVLMGLWKIFEENARSNAGRLVELERIVRLLDGEGLPVIPYKGLITAHEIFGDIRLREFEDQDILVRLADMPRVTALLCANGYRVEPPMAPAAEAALYRSREQYHRVLVHRDTGEKLEVHWKTDPRFPVERSGDEAWWESRPRVTLKDVPMRTFTPDEQLIVLCLHGAKHQGHRLGWLLEIAVLAGRHAIDWQWVDETITVLGCRRRVLASLALAHAWTAAALPSPIVAAIAAEPAIPAIAADISDRLFTGDVLERQAFERLRLDLKLYDRWAQRVRHVVDVTLTPTVAERAAYPLPHSLEFLYWPFRAMKLAAKYASPRPRR